MQESVQKSTGKRAKLTGARGTGPRELPISAKNARNPVTTDVCCHNRRMARDRPSPYVPCNDCLFLTGARGTGPREPLVV